MQTARPSMQIIFSGAYLIIHLNYNFMKLDECIK